MKKLNKSIYRSKGFTLIELLVVISIVGLLSSVVIASLNSSRDKGRVAAGQQFSAQVYHTIGVNMIGSWNFDECNGLTAKDTSGYSNNATLINGASWSTDTPLKGGCSVYFDGVNDYVSISSTIASKFQSIHGPSTLSLWFKDDSTSNGVSRRIFSDNCLEWGFYINNQNLYASVYSTINAGAIQTGRWYQAVLVHDYNNAYPNTIVKLYLNGQYKGQVNVTINTQNGYTNDAPYSLGVDACSVGTNFKGYVDDVKIYSSSLTAIDIGKIYAEELKENILAIGK